MKLSQQADDQHCSIAICDNVEKEMMTTMEARDEAVERCIQTLHLTHESLFAFSVRYNHPYICYTEIAVHQFEDLF